MSTLFHWSQFIYAAPSSWTEVPSVRDSPEAQLGSSLSTVATVCVCVLARECEREADVASLRVTAAYSQTDRPSPLTSCSLMTR